MLRYFSETGFSRKTSAVILYSQLWFDASQGAEIKSRFEMCNDKTFYAITNIAKLRLLCKVGKTFRTRSSDFKSTKTQIYIATENIHEIPIYTKCERNFDPYVCETTQTYTYRYIICTYIYAGTKANRGYSRVKISRNQSRSSKQPTTYPRYTSNTTKYNLPMYLNSFSQAWKHYVLNPFDGSKFSRPHHETEYISLETLGWPDNGSPLA